VVFDYSPGIFCELNLPVSAERRQRQQRSEHSYADKSDRSLVKPFLHANLYARAASLRRNLNRHRRRKARQIAQRALLASL
jgi:hypothetical protein